MRDKKDILLDELMPLIDAIEDFKVGHPLKPTGSLYNTVLTKCIDLLKSNGYVVSKSEAGNTSIKNIGDLVNHYYNILRMAKGNSIVPYRENAPDLAVAKALINNLQESTGYTYQEALNFASKMVLVLFRINKDLDINPEVLCSFKGAFGQDKMRWISERIIQHINKDAEEEARLIRQADADTEAYIKLKNVKFGWDDLEEIAKRGD